MSFYTALTGLNGSQADISATSNNIANVATTGYKRSKAEFGDIFATSPLQNSSSSIGSGTILKGIKQQFTQGNVIFVIKCIRYGHFWTRVFCIETFINNKPNGLY